jgi:hypothetical protein
MELLKGKNNSNSLQSTLANETYKLIRNQVEGLDKSRGKVAILGGLSIKVKNLTDVYF